MTRADDRGAVAVHAAVVALLLLMATLAIVQATSLIHLRHQVAAAADLAALAASQASVRGEDGCAAARIMARRNDAELEACRMDYDVATVTARARSTPWWGDRWVTHQDARAAPESYVVD